MSISRLDFTAGPGPDFVATDFAAAIAYRAR